MDKEYLRDVATEGAALHSEGQPERLLCDGILWALGELAAHGWISVLEKMPNPKTRCLTYNTLDGVKIRAYDGNVFYDPQTNQHPRMRVSHWKQIPPPPLTPNVEVEAPLTARKGEK